MANSNKVLGRGTIGSMVLGLAACIGIAMAPSSAFALQFECSPVRVTDQGNRVTVECSNWQTVGSGTFRFVSVPSSSTATADRFVSVATAAILAGRTFWVDAIDSTSSNPSGCGTANCRGVAGFGLTN